jgi:hypothetical protein
MSAIETRLGSRHAAARDAAERRKKLILAGLGVVFVALLAFQLPKLLKGSDSSSSTASVPATTTATPAATAAASGSLANVSTASSVKRVRAIRRMSAKDPFVPLIRESTTPVASSSSSSASAPAAPTAAPAPAAEPVTSQPSIGFTAPAAAPKPAATKPAAPKPAAKPVHVKPAAPTAAIIWTNGTRHVVGVSQVFKVGDAEFSVVAVTPKTMRIKAVGGAFAGGKQAITLRKGHAVTLTNTATGVQYDLLFTDGTTAAPTVVRPSHSPLNTAASAGAEQS